MDNVTHTLFAVTLGRTPLGRAGRGTTAALILASNAPDIDAVMGLRGGSSYLVWHRGPTHGLLGVVGLGVVSAALVAIGQRVNPTWNDERSDASFGMLVVVSMIGIMLHVLMDLATSYGTRLLSPFDWHWFAVEWMPIIDIYLLGVLAAGTIFGRVSEASKGRNAAIVLTLMATIYGVRAVAHHEALELAPRVFGPALPQPCDRATNDSPIDRWPRAMTVTSGPDGRRCLVEITAMPTFASPFRWRIVAHLSNAYELHDLDLLDARLRQPPAASEAFWRLTIRYPDQWSPAVEQAARTTLGQRFLGFSRFPAARWVIDQRTGVTTVRWTDMRFVGGLVALDQPVARPNLFTAVVRIDSSGRVTEQRLGP